MRKNRFQFAVSSNDHPREGKPLKPQPLAKPIVCPASGEDCLLPACAARGGCLVDRHDKFDERMSAVEKRQAEEQELIRERKLDRDLRAQANCGALRRSASAKDFTTFCTMRVLIGDRTASDVKGNGQRLVEGAVLVRRAAPRAPMKDRPKHGLTALDIALGWEEGERKATLRGRVNYHALLLLMRDSIRHAAATGNVTSCKCIYEECKKARLHKVKLKAIENWFKYVGPITIRPVTVAAPTNSWGLRKGWKPEHFRLEESSTLTIGDFEHPEVNPPKPPKEPDIAKAIQQRELAKKYRAEGRPDLADRALDRARQAEK